MSRTGGPGSSPACRDPQPQRRHTCPQSSCSAYAGNPFSGHVLSHGAWPAFSSVFLNYDSPFCIGTGAAAPWPAFPRTRGNTSGSPHGSHPWTFRWLGTTLNLQFNGVCFVKLRILTPLIVKERIEDGANEKAALRFPITALSFASISIFPG